MSFRKRHGIRDLGVGVGFRGPHVRHVLENRPPMDWFEIISENYFAQGGVLRANLEALRGSYPVVPHGVSLSIGRADPLDGDHLAQLRALVRRVEAPWCSDHLCWTGIGGVDVHDLLPMPMTAATLDHVVERTKRVQSELGVPFALENASSYMEFRESTIPEPVFLAEVAERSDCALLLDVNNVFVSAHNHGFDAKSYIDALPADRVVQIHLAGHTDKGQYLLDTHSDHVRAEVWALYRHAIKRCGAVSTLVEWDENIPSWDVLAAEAAQARQVREETLGRSVEPLGERVVSRLDDVQRFLAEAVRRTSPVACDDQAGRSAEALLKPSPRGMSSQQRLEVYREQFWLRHVPSLMEDYPTLAWVVGGEAAFRDLATHYLVAHPPRTWNLQRLGADVPAFVTTQAPWRDDALARDAALLDWAFMEAFDAPDAPAFDARVFASTPEDAWPGARLLLHPSLRMLRVAYPVHALREAVERGEASERPFPEAACVVVWRDAACRSHVRAIDPTAFALLAALQGGAPLGEACEAVARGGADAAGIEPQLAEWFQEWTGSQWVSAVHFELLR